MHLRASLEKGYCTFGIFLAVLLTMDAKRLRKPLPVKEEKYFIRPTIARYKTPGKRSDYLLYPLGIAHQEHHHLYWSNLLTLFNYDVFYDDQQVYRQGNFFPFYFFRSGFGKSNDYGAVWPLGGTVKNFFGKEEANWFLWPLWVKTQNSGTINYWYPWPLINYRYGKSHGFAFYPLGGHFSQDGVYDERYFLWPLGYHYVNFERQELKKGFLPFYAYEKSPNVRDLSIIWPIWGHRKEHNPIYEEHRILWPLWVQGRGEERYVNRWAPFYTHSKNKKRCLKKTWYLWPFVKELSWKEGDMNIYQEQFLYFVFWSQEQKNCKNLNFFAKKIHFWPIYSYWEDGHGHKQMQMLSPFEVFFPTNTMVRDIYTPLFALYRYDEYNGVIQQSFWFNLFQEKREGDDVHLHCKFLLDYKNTKDEKCFSLLNGLFEYKKVFGEKTIKLFWCKLKKHSKYSRDDKVL